uniref:F-box domain-containing protein n=1 Tax=Mycena chlorophos TaxID=658473 RepID=A0ABQ0M4N1_MYCCL|nr:predicted protein [Mycena chlorophos]
MSSPALLLDLPNELLLLIADSLRDEGLLAFTSTCTRINQLLISSLFQRANLPLSLLDEGWVSSISVRGADILSLQALAAAHSIHTVQHVCVDLYSSRVISSWQNYLLALDALTTLARRLKHLGAVELNPYFINQRKESEVEQCVQAMGAFINAVAQREDCALTVFGANDDRSGGGGPFVHTIQQVVRGENVTVFSSLSPPLDTRNRPRTPPPPSPTPNSGYALPPLLRSIVKTLTNFFSFPRRLFSPPPPPPPRFQSPPLPPPRTETSFRSAPRASTHSTTLLQTLPTSLRLTTLNLHSSYMLRAHYLPYTTELINTAPLHTLSLGGGLTYENHTTRELGLAHYDWALILPAFTLSHLHTLRIGSGVDVAVPDLMAFLARHETTIRTLDLGWHCPRGSLESAPVPLFHRLECLRATPEYALHFLAGENHADHLTHLVLTSDDVSTYGCATFARLIAFVETQYAAVAEKPMVDVLGKMQAEVKTGTVRMPSWSGQLKDSGLRLHVAERNP